MALKNLRVWILLHILLSLHSIVPKGYKNTVDKRALHIFFFHQDS